MSRQSQIFQLQRGDIERQPESVSVERDRLECLSQDLAAELTNRAITFRHGDESIWRDQAKSRVLPARENLETVKLARCERHKWLKIREKFSVFQRTAKARLIKFLCVAHE